MKKILTKTDPWTWLEDIEKRINSISSSREIERLHSIVTGAELIAIISEDNQLDRDKGNLLKLIACIEEMREALVKQCTCFPEPAAEVKKQFPHLNVKGCHACETLTRCSEGKFK